MLRNSNEMKTLANTAFIFQVDMVNLMKI